MSSDEQDEETKAISETKTEFVFFPPMCCFIFDSLERFEAEKVANLFPFFYVQRKQTVFVYKEASRSLVFVFGKKKKLNCWNGSKTKELANFMLMFTNICAFDFVSSGPTSVQTTRGQAFICSPSAPALRSSTFTRRARVPIKWPCFFFLPTWLNAL